MTKDARKRHLILEDPNIIKGLLILSVPLMLNNFIKTIHDIIDMYFVGLIPDKGVDAITSISLTFPVVFTFISLGIGLSVAGTALISQQVGAGQRDMARRYASNLLVLSVAVGFILMVISFFGAGHFMRWMGTEGLILEESTRYLKIRSFELPAVFVFFAFTATRQASGDTVTPVIYGVVSVVLNIILSPILITWVGLGVAGAAYATLIANIIIVPFGLKALFQAKTGITASREALALDRDIALHLVRTAIPAAVGQSVTAIGFGIMNGVIYSFGKETVAAFSVGNRLSSLILHPVMAMGGVLAAYLGQNIGNQNVERARETFRKAMVLSVSMMIVGSLLIMPFRPLFATFFIKDSPETLSLTIEYMFYLLIGLPLMAVFQTFIGTFNGTGNTKFTFMITISRLWLLRIPIIFAFKTWTTLGSSGVWYAMLLSNLMISLIAWILYQRVDYQPKIDIRKTQESAA